MASREVPVDQADVGLPPPTARTVSAMVVALVTAQPCSVSTADSASRKTAWSSAMTTSIMRPPEPRTRPHRLAGTRVSSCRVAERHLGHCFPPVDHDLADAGAKYVKNQADHRRIHAGSAFPARSASDHAAGAGTKCGLTGDLRRPTRTRWETSVLQGRGSGLSWRDPAVPAGPKVTRTRAPPPAASQTSRRPSTESSSWRTTVSPRPATPPDHSEARAVVRDLQHRRGPMLDADIDAAARPGSAYSVVDEVGQHAPEQRRANPDVTGSPGSTVTACRRPGQPDSRPR